MPTHAPQAPPRSQPARHVHRGRAAGVTDALWSVDRLVRIAELYGAEAEEAWCLRQKATDESVTAAMRP